MLTFDDYEYLREMEDIIEHFEIDEIIKNRLKNYDSSTNISWKDIKE